MLAEIYFRDPTDPRYQTGILEHSNKLEALISKLRMILYTNRGEVLDEPEMGMDLEYQLFEPGLSEGVIRDRFYAQCTKFIPESTEFKIDCQVSVQATETSMTGYLDITIDGQKYLGISI